MQPKYVLKMARNRKGRPRKGRKAHHVTLSLDEESWDVYNRRKVAGQNMSEEYQLMLKARYGKIVSSSIKLASWKEKLWELEKERKEARKRLEDEYESRVAQVVTVIQRFEAEIAGIEVQKSEAVVEAGTGENAQSTSTTQAREISVTTTAPQAQKVD